MTTPIVHWSDRHEPQLRAINLELTNHCNFKCSFCMNSKSGFRERGYISEQLLQKVVQELDKETSIHLCGIGEPSLHPQFRDILARLSASFDNLSLVTNGFALRNDQAIQALLSSTIKKINLSLDYTDPADFNRVKGGDLAEVLRRVLRYRELRERENSRQVLQINFLYEDSMKNYLDAVTTLTQLVGEQDCIYLREIRNLAGQVEVSTDKGIRMLDDMLRDFVDQGVVVIENWSKNLKHTNFLADKPRICRHIYNYYMLLWNGNVVPCCQDFNGELAICNAITDNLNLQELFLGNAYGAFRSRMERLDYRGLPLCASCDDYYKA